VASGAAEDTVRVPAASPTAPPATESAEVTAARTAEDVEETTALASRVRRIDESLTRLTAAHAGMALQTREGEEPEPDEDEAAEAPATPTRRPVLAAKILVAAVAFLLFAGTALSWGAFRWMESTVRPVDALDPTSGSIVDAAAQAGDDTVVVLGTASGSSGDTARTGTRTDTVVLTHVAASGDRVVTVSLPTDLEINRPPCQRWDQNAAAYLDETVPAETRTTLGSAYEVGGPRCTVRAVQQLTGLAVTRFVALDMPGVKDMVDALGGVEVCVERPVVDDRLGPVVPQAGTTTLDGEQAVRFAEASAVPTDSSPAFGQAQRQQRLLAAVFGEALSTRVLLSPGTTRDVVTALGHSMLADNAGMQDLLALSTAQRRLDADGVTFVPLPVSGVPNTRGNLELRTGDANELFSAIRKDRPLPESATTPAARSTAAAPDSVTVDVLNAAGRDGLATQIGTTLRGLGYGVGAVSNAPEPSADTVVKFSADRSAQAQAIAGLVPTARLVPDTGTSGSLQLVLGTSFDGAVRTPAQGAVAPAAQPATAPPATCD
jgi:LCP family protein required for cell wall assembly